VGDVMSSARARTRGVFRRERVDALLAEPHTETPLGGSQLWQVALLELWLERHGL
jgi:asparagine synthase (glutamine-hydrolysing)